MVGDAETLCKEREGGSRKTETRERIDGACSRVYCGGPNGRACSCTAKPDRTREPCQRERFPSSLTSAVGTHCLSLSLARSLSHFLIP